MRGTWWVLDRKNDYICVYYYTALEKLIFTMPLKLLIERSVRNSEKRAKEKRSWWTAWSVWMHLQEYSVLWLLHLGHLLQLCLTTASFQTKHTFLTESLTALRKPVDINEEEVTSLFFENIEMINLRFLRLEWSSLQRQKRLSKILDV